MEAVPRARKLHRPEAAQHILLPSNEKELFTRTTVLFFLPLYTWFFCFIAVTIIKRCVLRFKFIPKF